MKPLLIAGALELSLIAGALELSLIAGALELCLYGLDNARARITVRELEASRRHRLDAAAE